MRQEKQHHIDTAAVLLLFTVFAFCMLSVLLTGAQSYERLTAGGQQAYGRRTAAQYLTTRVRQGDAAGAVTVDGFGGVPDGTLSICEDGYVTRVYVCGGWLRELYTAEDGTLQPEDGEKLFPAQALVFSLEGGLLRAALTDMQGGVTELTWRLRCGKGAAA